MARTKSICRTACDSWAAIMLLLCALSCIPVRAQESGGPAGQAEVAFQGYYLSGSGQPLIQTTGMSENTTQFIEGLGLVTANVEGYGGGGFRTGNMFAGLQGTPLFGWHWDFVGGDFQFDSNMVKNPFSNIYTPEIAGRGGQIAMRRSNRSYRFFMGEDTVLEGPRIPFRLILPQRVIGATMQQNIGERLALGVRYLNLSTNPSALTSDSTYILPGHTYRDSNSLTLQSTFKLGEHLSLYGETGYSAVTSFTSNAVAQKPLSFLIGPSWETSRAVVRGNYVHQSTSYMPLLGYFAGDRKGPYVEAHYRLTQRTEVYGSTSGYSNNLEKDSSLPSFRSFALTTGASLLLPWKVSTGGSFSYLKLTENDPAQPGAAVSDNSQINLNASRPFGRHNLRFALIQMKLDVNSQPQTQRFEEIEDTFAWKHLVIGGATRFQNSQSSGQNLNSVFFRGSLQANIKRISAYGYMEKGDDLVNKSVFSTNSVRSTVAGISAPLSKNWTLQFESFQNQLLTSLNPENVFLFGNGDQGLNTQLAGFNQRSMYFRISRRYVWGRPLAQGSTMAEYAASRAPLVGSIEGFVTEAALSGPQPAPNVTVILDRNRTAITDDTGRYAFASVPEGVHQVELNMEELPADYSPGPENSTTASVSPRAVVRTDFNVLRLTNVAGKIIAPRDMQLDDVVIRIVGAKTYTTPYSDGDFSFYNLREGEYQIEIDAATIPEGYILASPSPVTIAASTAQPPTITFEFKVKPAVEKKVREVLKQEIHVSTPASDKHN